MDQSTNRSTQETFYELLIKMCKNEQHRKKALPALGSSMEIIFSKYEDVEYPTIFRLVNKSSLTREQIDTLLEILVEVENQIEEEHLDRMVRKMRRHFLLSYEQWNSFNSLDKEFRAKLEQSEKDLIKAQTELSKVQDELDDALSIILTIDNETSKIYAQFVTILGIFTAIVLSVFGGLQIISATFANIQTVPIWKTTLIGSMVSIAVLCMLFLLTRWISTIVHKTFGHQNERHFMQLITNNGAFATGIFIFCYLIIAAVVFSSNEARTTMKSLINSLDSIPILILLSIPVVIGVGVVIKAIDLRKYK